MVNLGNLGIVCQILNHLEGILHVTLYAQRQRLNTLQQDPCIEGADGSTGVTQDDGTDTGYECGCTGNIGKYCAMV